MSLINRDRYHFRNTDVNTCPDCGSSLSEQGEVNMIFPPGAVATIMVCDMYKYHMWLDINGELERYDEDSIARSHS